MKKCRCLENIPEDYGIHDKPFHDKLRIKYPLLNNKKFTKKYLYVVQVTEVLEDTYSLHRKTCEFIILDRHKIKDIKDYLDLLFRDNLSAREIYQQVVKAHRLNKPVNQKDKQRKSTPIFPTLSKHLLDFQRIE